MAQPRRSLRTGDTRGIAAIATAAKSPATKPAAKIKAAPMPTVEEGTEITCSRDRVAGTAAAAAEALPGTARDGSAQAVPRGMLVVDGTGNKREALRGRRKNANRGFCPWRPETHQ